MVDCTKCNGTCCRYVTISLGTPKDVDLETAKWLASHSDLFIYIGMDDKMYLQVNKICKYLEPKTFLCQIYEKRPNICRDYKETDCEMNPGNEKKYKRGFFNVSDLEKYENDFAKDILDIKNSLKQKNIKTRQYIAACPVCSKECCEHVTLRYDFEDINWDEIRWFLCHDGVNVFIDDDNKLFVHINAPCKSLYNENCSLDSKPSFFKCNDENKAKFIIKHKLASIEDLKEYRMISEWP